MDNYDRRQLGDHARRLLRHPHRDTDHEVLAHGVLDLLVFLAAAEIGAAGRPLWDAAADLAEARQELAHLRDEIARLEGLLTIALERATR